MMKPFPKAAICESCQHHEDRVRELLSQISHDLKTPVTSLSLKFQLLRNQLLLQSKSETTLDAALFCLQRADQDLKRLTALLDELPVSALEKYRGQS